MPADIIPAEIIDDIVYDNEVDMVNNIGEVYEAVDASIVLNNIIHEEIEMADDDEEEIY